MAKQQDDGPVTVIEGYKLGRRGKKYVADYGTDAGRKRATLGEFRTQALALEALKNFIEIRKAVQRQQASHTIGKLWEMWMKDRKADFYNNDIYEANWVSLKPFFGHRFPAQLTRQDCREYCDGRFALKRSTWTVNTEMVRLRSCLIWAEEEGLIAKCPKVWVPARGKPRQTVITADEAKALLLAAYDMPHVYLFIVLALTTAARHTAILELEWSRINFETGIIDYEVVVEINPMSKAWKKGRAQVPMNALARAALLRAKEAAQTKYVIEYRAKPLKDIREGFAIAVGRAGLGEVVPAPTRTKPNRMKVVTKVTPHTIRHSVNSWLKTNDVDARKRADLLGQKDIRVNELVYSHADNTKYLADPVRMINDALASPATSIDLELADDDDELGD